METNTTVCPGCGLVLPRLDGPLLAGYNASSECIALFSQLSAFTNSLGDKEFSHQHVVDAYGAQHVGLYTKKVVPTMTLVGLFLQLEHNYTGIQVQRAHMVIADQTKDWPDFEKPQSLATVTVLDVLKVPDSKKMQMLRVWCAAVWDIWASEHEKVVKFTKKYLEYL